jgi:aspartyl protease family protein
VRNLVVWILILSLLLMLALLFRGGGAEGLGDATTSNYLYSTYYLVWAAAVGASVLVLFRNRIGQALKAAALWAAIGAVAIIGYTYRGELAGVKDRMMSELIPGRPLNRGAHTVEIVRTRSGEFQVAAAVNGVRVPMLLDTGASSIVLTQEAAKAAGLPLEMLEYNVTVETANGRARAASVTLDRVAVGDVVERAVPALIAQPGQLRTSLLGMSFLNRLESWEMRGDKVVMRGYP